MYGKNKVWIMSPVSTVGKFIRTYPAGTSGFLKRLTYAPYPYKTLQAYRQDDIFENKDVFILQELKPVENWALLLESSNWLADTGCGRFDTRSYVIKGSRIYRHRIVFKSENDRLAFMLKYPELILGQ